MVETETRATICKSWMPPPILFFLLRARGSFVFFRVQKGERGHTVNGYFRRETPLSSLSLVFSYVPSCRRTTVSILKRAKRDRSSSPPSPRFPARFYSRGGERWEETRRVEFLFILLTRSLVIVDGNSLQLQIAISMINARLVDAVLLGDHFPELNK